MSSATTQRRFQWASLSDYALKRSLGEMEILLYYSGLSFPYRPRIHDEGFERFNNLLRESSTCLQTLYDILDGNNSKAVS